MTQTVEYSKCVEFLKEHDGYLLLTHIRPDGDTLGSAAALCHILRKMGKTAYVLENPDASAVYTPFLQPYLAPAGFQPDTRIGVDMAAEDLFPKNHDGSPIQLCIDHHPSNSGYAAVTLCNPEKASCGEIILDLAKKALPALDPDLASLLYIAVSTDCGCFVYANTRADTHRAAAELMEAGADTKRLNKLLFRSCSAARLKLEGQIYAGMRQYGERGCVNVVTVTQEMMQQCGATEDDCEDLASLAGRVAGNRVAVTIREIGPRECKVSIRSTEDFDSSAICALHGGGGHKMASGCIIHADPDETRDEILMDILEAL